MSKYNFILFDWDGTIAKTLDIWLKTYKYLCRKYNIDVSKLSDLEVVETSFGKWSEGLKDLGLKNYNEAYKEAVKIVDRKVKTVALYKNAKSVLVALKDGNKKLALHTSSFKNLLFPAIEHHDLNNYFDIILTKDDVLKGKPDPEIINRELTFFKAPKDEVLVIGDSDHDIKSGKSAGVSTALFYPPENEKFYRKEFLIKDRPDFIISDLSELLKIEN